MIVTIDGPAGAGKSTAARKLAEKLGIAYLDTGATYRAATLKAMGSGIDLSDPSSLLRAVREMGLEMRSGPDGVRVLLDGRDVTDGIRTRAVTDNSHYVASSPATREVLVDLQRRLGRQLGDFVAEGRDQGSVVFPQADMKFYLNASPEMRARRRCDEMQARGAHDEFDEVLEAILRRDLRDKTRAVGALVRPQGAVEIDTTDMTIEEMTAELLRHVEAMA